MPHTPRPGQGACRRCRAEMYRDPADNGWRTVYRETDGGGCPDPATGTMNPMHDVQPFDRFLGGFGDQAAAETFAAALVEADPTVADAVAYRDERGALAPTWRAGIVSALSTGAPASATVSGVLVTQESGTLGLRVQIGHDLYAVIDVCLLTNVRPTAG